MYQVRQLRKDHTQAHSPHLYRSTRKTTLRGTRGPSPSTTSTSNRRVAVTHTAAELSGNIAFGPPKATLQTWRC